MNNFLRFFFLFIALPTMGQQSESLIPRDAVSVFSINNIHLLQKISLDQLVQYEFMEEVQQELFDGSTSGKTLKDTGIDFDQKMNVFFGKTPDFELSGFSFGVTNQAQLFEVFDDFEPVESAYEGVTFYSSYFNLIAIRGKSAVLFRISPSMDMVNSITDSIWYARGNEYPWNEESMEEFFQEIEPEESNEIEFFEDMETEENTSTPLEEESLPIADADPTSKTYYELMDSVQLFLHKAQVKQVCDELFLDNENLLKNAPLLVERLKRDVAGVFYFDNGKSIDKNASIYQLQMLYPSFFRNLEELYDGNVFLGDLILGDQSVEMHVDTKYGDKLGSIYQEMTDAKFDKNVLKYIHKDNSAFFTYRINMGAMYEQAHAVIVPLLEAESDPRFSSTLLVLELWDTFLNKDAVFDTYKGNMFGTYNGIEKIKTKKFVFEYDEETFEYTEKEVEAEEDMPLFTLGFSTDRSDIPQKILKYLARIDPELRNEGDYWIYENQVLGSAPLYMILKNDLFIFTNDPRLATTHPNGYGANSLAKNRAKQAKKSGFIYGHADLGMAVESLPRGLFNDQENEMLDVIRGKSGKIELTSSKTSPNTTSMKLRYEFDGQTDDSGAYILDLINSLYVISK